MKQLGTPAVQNSAKNEAAIYESNNRRSFTYLPTYFICRMNRLSAELVGRKLNLQYTIF
jgi:hypothetical protein